MITKFEKLAKDMQDGYVALTARAVDRLREATLNAADMVSRTRQPVRRIAETGIKLNRISHKSVEKLVKQQAHIVESAIDSGAKNLKLAARADNLRDLFADQIAALPKAGALAGESARVTIDIVRDTGDELGGVFRVVPAKPKARTKVKTKPKTRAKAKTTRTAARKTTAGRKRKPATRKRATQTARKTTKKASARKAPAVKRTASAVRKTAATASAKAAEAAGRIAA
jgi:DNA-binding protein HU-beta